VRRKPKLSSQAEADLQLMGVEAVRDWLRRSPPSPPEAPVARETFRLANSELSRADLIAWVQWKEDVAIRRENRRFRWTFAFVVIAALPGVIAAWPILKSWIFDPV
jgi:hypothetical protein